MVGLPDFRSHSKSIPFATQPVLDHSKPRLGQISDPHCIARLLDLNRGNLIHGEGDGNAVEHLVTYKCEQGYLLSGGWGLPDSSWLQPSVTLKEGVL